MRLEKHYFDAVTAWGDVFMAYAARLDWAPACTLVDQPIDAHFPA